MSCFILLPLQWVASIDIGANADANANVLVKLSESFTEQAGQVGEVISSICDTDSRGLLAYAVCAAVKETPITFH